jgi:predicted MFS family arabinose efflux permease
MVVVAPLLTQLGLEFGITPGTAGLTMTAYTIPGFVIGLVSGPLSDRFGRKPFLVAGGLLTGGATILGAFAPTFDVLLATRVAAGFGPALLSPAIGGLIGDLFPLDRGRAFGVTYGANAVANVLGVPAAGLLAEATTWRWSLALVGGVAVFAAAVLLVSLREPRRPLAAGPAQNPYLRVIRERSAVAMLVATAFAATLLWSWSTFVVVYFQSFGLSQGTASTFALTGGVGVLIGSQVGGRLGDRVGHRQVVIVGGILSSAIVVSIVSLPIDLALAAAFNLGLLTIIGARSAAQAALITAQVPEARATMFALAGAFSSGAIALAAAVGGRILDVFGFGGLGVFGASAGIAATIIVATLVRETRPAATDLAPALS